MLYVNFKSKDIDSYLSAFQYHLPPHNWAVICKHLQKSKNYKKNKQVLTLGNISIKEECIYYCADFKNIYKGNMISSEISEWTAVCVVSAWT